ncbi:hypothetical protein [Acinetobacter populi]|uniref:Phage abortive infection protein n=1 Tax=Acinetobacter populi TaxID=1582270 RepID=A0A1Z9Z2N8_9GAMM|nr:hypothetical protein [Acinetobacter populi]OUY08731.1 hypothetical protein CAP51_03710 [Acinetobacter populi]
MSDSTEKSIKKDFKISDYIGWILLGITLWFLFPWIFSIFFNWILKDPVYYGENFGAVGDIYGSLNTLISSIALCAIAYSTWLQVTSLKETRETNQQQLRESQNAIFINEFYNLLNYNRNIFNSLVITNSKESLKAIDIFSKLSDEFTRLLNEEWKDRIDTLTPSEVRLALRTFIRKISDETKSTGFYSAFNFYPTIINYVKVEQSGDEKKKLLYMNIIGNSMYYGEKKALLWLAVNSQSYRDALMDSNLLDLKIVDREDDDQSELERKARFRKFIKHFGLDKSSFRNSDVFNDDKNPT